MATIIELPTFWDKRGNLTVIDNIESTLPFAVKRVFYIYRVDDSVRGGHRHHRTTQAAICITGHCKIYNNNGREEETFVLDSAHKCLIIEPEDWHTMSEFSENAILLVFASTAFDPNDYIYDPY